MRIGAYQLINRNSEKKRGKPDLYNELSMLSTQKHMFCVDDFPEKQNTCFGFLSQKSSSEGEIHGKILTSEGDLEQPLFSGFSVKIEKSRCGHSRKEGL